jgi:hypothetical protein
MTLVHPEPALRDALRRLGFGDRARRGSSTST